MLHLGCDPGLSGAIAILDDQGGVVMCRDMPTLKTTRSRKQIDLYELLICLRAWMNRDSLRVTIETPGVRPMQHAAAGLKVGIGWGRIMGMVETLGVACDAVSPQKWQKAILGPVAKGCSKDAARAKAQALWPEAELGRRKTQDRSDALLLAEYGRRMWGQR